MSTGSVHAPRLLVLFLLALPVLAAAAGPELPMPAPPRTRAGTSARRTTSAPAAPEPSPGPEPAAATTGPAPAASPAPGNGGTGPARDEKPRLVVLELSAAGGVEPQLASALTEGITQEASSRGFFQVISAKEIQTMLGQERQRQVMGCSTDSGSCLAELAGAIGARFVLSGSLARLGGAFQLTLQTLDTVKAIPIGRATRIANDLTTLRAQLVYAVAEATATPLPPPPSRILPYAVITGGALTFLGGGLIFFDAVSREAGIVRELDNGTQNPAALQPLSVYQQQRREIIDQKLVGLAVAAGGAALVGLGLWLNPPDTGAGGAHATLLPTVHGFAVVGVLP